MILGYLLVLLALSVYSYSQIDLNLTLFQNSGFLAFQKVMIQLGYFNRPASTVIFVVLLLTLFMFYLLLLRQKKAPNLWVLVGGIVTISLFSYPAFSHDFFNYLFDARIVTFYHQNPYLFKPQDFPADLWLRFMHWVHRTYPYGPVWLAITLLPSFLGFGKFVVTVFNFKLLFAAFYLGSTLLVKRIAGSKYALFFAANPLVVVESLISPHLDAAMVFFFLLAVFLARRQQKFWAVGAVILSGGIKFLTLVTLPLFFQTKRILELSLVLLLLVLVPVILQREVYPWYFLPPLAVASLLIDNPKIFFLSLTASFGLLLHYVPFLWVGQEVVFWENILTVAPILLCVLGLIFFSEQMKVVTLPEEPATLK